MCRTLCDDNILLFWALAYFSGSESVHGQDWLVGIFGEMGRTYLLDLVIIGVDYLAEFLSICTLFIGLFQYGAGYVRLWFTVMHEVSYLVQTVTAINCKKGEDHFLYFVKRRESSPRLFS